MKPAFQLGQKNPRKDRNIWVKVSWWSKKSTAATQYRKRKGRKRKRGGENFPKQWTAARIFPLAKPKRADGRKICKARTKTAEGGGREEKGKKIGLLWPEPYWGGQ